MKNIEEDEEFQRIEREAAMRQEVVALSVGKQQMPLSDKWIESCWRKSVIGPHVSYREYLAIVREVERAHSIKENSNDCQ